MAGAYESGEDIDGIGMAAGNDGGVNTRVDSIQAGGGDAGGVFAAGRNEGGIKSKVGC
jgi:hypothetical protein